MNNQKMTKTAKNLDMIANVCGKITGAVGIVCILTAVFTLIFGEKMFSQGSLTLDLDFIKFHLNDNVPVNVNTIKLFAFFGTLGTGILCCFVYYISTVLRKIFLPMKDGRPFETGVSENLQKIGCAVLTGGFITRMLEVAARMLLVKAYSISELFVSPDIDKIEYTFTLNLDFVLIAIVIFLLSYIFSYGQKLQQDSDETL